MSGFNNQYNNNDQGFPGFDDGRQQNQFQNNQFQQQQNFQGGFQPQGAPFGGFQGGNQFPAPGGFQGGFDPNAGGFQAQGSFPTPNFSNNSTAPAGEAPADGGDANPFADNPFASSNPFGGSSGGGGFTEFKPKGVVGIDMGDDDGGFGALEAGISNKKNKKKNMTNEERQAESKRRKEEEEAKLSTKGKSSEFFIMDYEPGDQRDPYGNCRVPTQAQKLFIWQHYPMDSADSAMIVRLYTLYQEAFAMEEQAKIEAEAYKKKPKASGTAAYEEESSMGSSQGMSGMGGGLGGGMGGSSATTSKKTKRLQDEKKKVEVQKKVDKSKKTKDADVERKKDLAKMAVKAKDIDVVADPRCVDIDETKTPASLVFIGHVDAGKSTISGQIVLQMGLVDDRTIQQFKEEAIKKGRDSWWLAYVMDNSEEEKAKGKTVDIGRTCFDTPKKSWTIFDAPGHKNYVPNMIQGVCQADYAGLVISARQGEFESGFEKDGQTREHIQLVRSLGVKKLVIVVNKMDEQSVKWKKSRFDEIKKNLTPFLYATGYTDADLYWIPISGLGGDNITEKSDKCSWYEGPPLMEILDDMPMEYRDPAAPLRVPVMDKMKDQKMIVFGKVEQGTLRLGDKLAIAPSNRPCQVLQIENFKDELVKLARPGDNVKISVSNLAEEDVRKGDCLCPREIPMHSSQVLMCEIRLLELRVPVLTAGSSFTIHLHTYSDLVDIQTIEWTIEKDPASGADLKKEAPKFAKSGSLCMVRIKTRMPVPVEKEEVLGALGRFTLRDEGKTVALGKICKFVPVRKDGIVRPPVPSASAAAKEEKKTDDAVTVDKSQPNMVFNMETGQMEEAKPTTQLEGIAEGDSDE